MIPTKKRTRSAHPLSIRMQSSSDSGLPSLPSDRLKNLKKDYRVFMKKSHVIQFRRVLQVEELQGRDMTIMKHILLDDDMWIRHVHLHLAHPPVSGRFLETVLTKWPPGSCAYYLLPGGGYSRMFVHGAYFFDASESYKSFMALYSKSYFDTFSRGSIVLYTCKGKPSILLSLCQYMLFHWSLRFGLFDFLADVKTPAKKAPRSFVVCLNPGIHRGLTHGRVRVIYHSIPFKSSSTSSLVVKPLFSTK